MNLSALITDNITEVLVKVIEFTQTRQKILTRNLNEIDSPGFVPMDLEVDEFSDLLNYAVDEHIRNQRLVLCDTENIKFGVNGSLRVKPVLDRYGEELLQQSLDEYIELQVTRLLENSLNQRVAAELLRQKQGDKLIF